MDRTRLFVPNSVRKEYLNLVGDLITFVPSLTEPHVRFERTDGCACSTRDLLAIKGRSIITGINKHLASQYPLYALPEDCTLDEAFMIMAWLLRNKFKSFKTRIVNGSLQRSLESNSYFKNTLHGNCCETFHLKYDPVFMLKSIVLSAYGKGPTLESCLQSKQSL